MMAAARGKSALRQKEPDVPGPIASRTRASVAAAILIRVRSTADEGGEPPPGYSSPAHGPVVPTMFSSNRPARSKLEGKPPREDGWAKGPPPVRLHSSHATSTRAARKGSIYDRLRTAATQRGHPERSSIEEQDLFTTARSIYAATRSRRA
ncbi:hypothetical protein CABS01_16565 [Colletotrichum abscissum]|uniref:uncharacterized protein n=1 Tax=Colletotrichum abscissum TaxID=1671311 RepID=UPI0027D4BA5E|nr:uncharacterized protein CABS01_16565 [Colletotrichum abscissum]KAK1519797.1 hypothetical protein CABS01_16565 [Colletotrichum abscissum]